MSMMGKKKSSHVPFHAHLCNNYLTSPDVPEIQHSDGGHGEPLQPGQSCAVSDKVAKI